MELESPGGRAIRALLGSTELEGLLGPRGYLVGALRLLVAS